MAEVVMPQLGESVTEGTIGRWLKKVGEHVDKYESLLEVETDKVNTEIPSPIAGTLRRILAEEGATVAVGQPICELEAEEETGPPPTTAAEAAADAQAPDAAPATPSAPAAPPGRGRYSPAVRRLAATHHIDPATLVGTGAQGRVTRQDVLAAVAQREAASAAAVAPAAPAPSPAAPAPAAAPQAGDEVVPLSQLRRVIAERLTQSKTTIPHAWMMTEVDVSGLVALRERLRADFERREGIALTYLPFMMQAVVSALRAVPVLNAQWDGDRIIYRRAIHLGIATATDRGLVVPVVRDADRKSLVGLAHDAADLVARARAGRLKVEDLQGATFTIDNTGPVGAVLTYPIINPPEVGIVTLEAIVKRPVVVDDMIAIRSMVNVCVSFDHRVVDGADAGRFLRAVKQALEAYGPDSAVQ